ncbi:MAG: hypothetical protein IPK52_09130 [Chloroflexi bacterium]|nr:hypothetical protein [Chloroflexota bacterium]
MSKRNRTSTPFSFLRRRVILHRLSAYVRGELSPDARREASRLIDSDASAYAEYLRVRETDRAFTADLAPHGRPERAQLERAFANIGAALNGRTPLYTLRLRRPTDWRTSLAAFVLATLMLVPLFIGINRVAAIGIATQPQPRTIILDGITPTGASPDLPNETLTPELVTAQFVARATPAAPETE